MSLIWTLFTRLCEFLVMCEILTLRRIVVEVQLRRNLCRIDNVYYALSHVAQSCYSVIGGKPLQLRVYKDNLPGLRLISITCFNKNLRYRGEHNASDFCTNRKLICDLLLVINILHLTSYNLHPILHRFQVMADCWSNFR